MIIGLHLVVLLLIVGLLIRLISILKGLLNRFNELTEKVGSLERPTRDEVIGSMTTSEAQKEYIRLNSIIDTKAVWFAKILRNEIMAGLNGSS